MCDKNASHGENMSEFYIVNLGLVKVMWKGKAKHINWIAMFAGSLQNK
jgi:hypothetical protein